MLSSCLLIVATEKTKEDREGLQPRNCTKKRYKAHRVLSWLTNNQQDLESPVGFPEEVSKLSEVKRHILSMGGILPWAGVLD